MELEEERRNTVVELSTLIKNSGDVCVKDEKGRWLDEVAVRFREVVSRLPVDHPYHETLVRLHGALVYGRLDFYDTQRQSYTAALASLIPDKQQN